MSDSALVASRAAMTARSFVRFLRWFTGLFAVASVIVIAVLMARAPDCIAIGVSVLRAEDCTNRDTYYLLLAGSATASICFSALLLASSYAIELLGVLASGRLQGERDQTLADRAREA